MNVRKLLLATVTVLSLGLTGCSDDAADISPTEGEGKNSTNVSVTLKMSQNSNSKTANSLSDNNKIGEWAGKDKVETVTIYLVDGSSVTEQTFTVGKDYVRKSDGGQIVLNPLQSAAIKTSAGSKKVYALINGAPEVRAALSKTPVAEFEKAYNETALALGNSGTSTTVSTSADKLALKNENTDETVVMTNVSPSIIVVEPNITASETIAETSPKNRVSISLERAVARVMVSTEESTYKVTSGSSTILGTISDIRWVLAQGESSLYIQRKSDWITPNYMWLPKDSASYYGMKITGTDSKYDYSGLFENYVAADQFGGTPVATMEEYSTDPKKGITNELNAKLSGKFILPNTHKYGEGTASSYKKGNTAYVLIRAKFTPSAAAFGDGEAYTPENDFYVGANGKFYISAANAVNPAKGGVTAQTVAKYVKGKVLYYAWVNPDAIPSWYNSPVLRNNIYHIHITGFKNLGTNWNPLFPEDQNSTTPLNPDPKPHMTGILEPKNPIDPTDPLTIPETWMSVDVKVLPWTLHSYSVDLGI